ncbi:hypothetical protein ACPCAJ_14925 [Streptomyces griseoincarnatus]
MDPHQDSGAPPGDGGAAVREIACDESGSDGENLTGGNTDVFAHAGVQVPVADAARALREIRDRIRSPATEYKATHLLREKHRTVLEWFLAPGGPVHGAARVHLTEKSFCVLDRLAGVLLDDRGAAAELYRTVREALGAEDGQRFLSVANRLLRIRNGAEPGSSVPLFFETVDGLRRACAGTDAGSAPGRLAAGRGRAEAYRAGLLDGPAVRIPVLNPLLPAIVATAAYWSGPERRPVRLVHDRQNLLTPGRIAWIEETARRSGVALTELRLVVARDDPRVQLADFLAGIARKAAGDALRGDGDPGLVALLRPYVDPASLWGDGGTADALGLSAPNSSVRAGN